MIKQTASCLAEIHKLDYEIIPNGLDHMIKNHHTLQQTMNHIKTDYPLA
ncbi:MAG: hypothetical protein HGN29_08555 [Asgard group archaeon]|nr:hypothetical protein [Asgard group archaeon]